MRLRRVFILVNSKWLGASALLKVPVLSSKVAGVSSDSDTGCPPVVGTDTAPGAGPRVRTENHTCVASGFLTTCSDASMETRALSNKRARSVE